MLEPEIPRGLQPFSCENLNWLLILQLYQQWRILSFFFPFFFFFGRKKFKEIILPNEIKYFSNTLFSGTKWKERRRTFQEGSDMVYILLQASARAVCYFISCPGTEEPGGLPSMGLHRVGHDWRDSAAALVIYSVSFRCSTQHIWRHSTVCMC